VHHASQTDRRGYVREVSSSDRRNHCVKHGSAFAINAARYDHDTTLASMERTEKQWIALLEAAGSEIVEKKVYENSTGESIIVAKAKM
jgi:hypothetical protein